MHSRTTRWALAGATQSVLSSGESEFHGIVRAAAFGTQTRQLLRPGVPLPLDILCDSSAARVQVLRMYDTSA